MGDHRKTLLIVYHSASGRTSRLAEAVRDGASHEDIESVEVRCKPACEADAQDLLDADGVIYGTPENFGYMSGGLKDFFDRTFYAVEGQIRNPPYGVFISAGNDGTGALTAIRRIVRGFPMNEVQAPVIVRGEITPQALQEARDLGTALAFGLDAGVNILGWSQPQSACGVRKSVESVGV